MRYLSLISCLFITTNVYAIFCPTNFSAINYGDSLQQVIAQCGPPLTQQHYQSTGNLVEQWTYFVKPNGYQNNTVKMIILISNNAVTNITLDDQNQNESAVCTGMLQPLVGAQQVQAACNITKSTPENLASTAICGFPIKLGDNGQVVQTACGKPAMMERVAQETLQSDTLAMDELTYAGPPRVLLVFENERLKDRRFL